MEGREKEGHMCGGVVVLLLSISAFAYYQENSIVVVWLMFEL
jgi:hypothetical protein